MEKSTNPIKTEKVVLGILELEKVTESDVGGGVGKSDTKVTSRRGRRGKTSIFRVTSFMNGPLLKSFVKFLTEILSKIPY